MNPNSNQQPEVKLYPCAPIGLIINNTSKKDKQYHLFGSGYNPMVDKDITSPQAKVSYAHLQKKLLTTDYTISLTRIQCDNQKGLLQALQFNSLDVSGTDAKQLPVLTNRYYRYPDCQVPKNTVDVYYDYQIGLDHEFIVTVPAKTKMHITLFYHKKISNGQTSVYLQANSNVSNYIPFNAKIELSKAGIVQMDKLVTKSFSVYEGNIRNLRFVKKSGNFTKQEQKQFLKLTCNVTSFYNAVEKKALLNQTICSKNYKYIFDGNVLDIFAPYNHADHDHNTPILKIFNDTVVQFNIPTAFEGHVVLFNEVNETSKEMHDANGVRINFSHKVPEFYPISAIPVIEKPVIKNPYESKIIKLSRTEIIKNATLLIGKGSMDASLAMSMEKITVLGNSRYLINDIEFKRVVKNKYKETDIIEGFEYHTMADSSYSNMFTICKVVKDIGNGAVIIQYGTKSRYNSYSDTLKTEILDKINQELVPVNNVVSKTKSAKK